MIELLVTIVWLFLEINGIMLAPITAAIDAAAERAQAIAQLSGKLMHDGRPACALTLMQEQGLKRLNTIIRRDSLTEDQRWERPCLTKEHGGIQLRSHAVA